MTLPLGYYLEQYPGVALWLGTVQARGYAQGASLVEGPYLGSDPDCSITGATILLLLEEAGYIRRSDLDPSHSQQGFACLRMGSETAGKGAKSRKLFPDEANKSTWQAWTRTETTAELARATPDCDWCTSGVCWTHKKA
jgi:hypothetical protein